MTGQLSAAWVIELLGQPNPALSRGRERRWGRNGSLSVDLARGVWRDHEAGDGGGVLDLIRRQIGGTRADAATWLERRGEVIHCVPPSRTEEGKKPPALRMSDAALGHAVQRRDTGHALAIWRASQLPNGGPVERYLAGRGLALPAEPERVLRFHLACPMGNERLPAMVALIRNALTGEPQGVHRTFLTADGERARRSDGAKLPKMMLGAAVSGAVMLSPDHLVEAGLAISEGIETGLAALARAPWLPMWAALSAGGIAGFPLLPGIEHLTIYADADGPGLDAAKACARRWAECGRYWAIEHPAEPGRDFADLAQGEAA